MSCPNNDPCAEPCTDCLETNGCYDNCGCINPTTFECITKPGVLSAINVTNDMNGKQVLQAINDVINGLTVDPPGPGSDIYSKVSATDTTSSYLSTKLLGSTYITTAVVNPGTNEKLKFSITPSSLISSNSGNILQQGTDGKLRVLPISTSADIQVVGINGITVTGTGPASDPFLVSTSGIVKTRTCFDNVWKVIPLLSSGIANVTKVSGTPYYRYRYDGTIEFKGSLTYTVVFGAYSTGTRKYTVPCGTLATTCISSAEQTGTVDMKGINYVEAPYSPTDSLSQTYGYIIRKTAQNLILEFQSSYTVATTKTIVVNFEGCISYPTI